MNKIDAANAEIIMSKYPTQGADGMYTIDSTACAKNEEEFKKLYGDGDDVFNPEVIKVGALHINASIVDEQKDMSFKRPF